MLNQLRAFGPYMGLYISEKPTPYEPCHADPNLHGPEPIRPQAPEPGTREQKERRQPQCWPLWPIRPAPPRIKGSKVSAVALQQKARRLVPVLGGGPAPLLYDSPQSLALNPNRNHKSSDNRTQIASLRRPNLNSYRALDSLKPRSEIPRPSLSKG